MTDIQAAAEAESWRTFHEGIDGGPLDRAFAELRREGFVRGAVWAQAQLTPTREQIAQCLASTREPEYQGIEQEDLDDADAILGLLKELIRSAN